MMQGTENGIFAESAFSHVSCETTLNIKKHNKGKPISTTRYIKLIKGFTKDNYTPKAKDLTQLNITLEDAINQFTGRSQL